MNLSHRTLLSPANIGDLVGIDYILINVTFDELIQCIHRWGFTYRVLVYFPNIHLWYCSICSCHTASLSNHLVCMKSILRVNPRCRIVYPVDDGC